MNKNLVAAFSVCAAALAGIANGAAGRALAAPVLLRK